MSRKFNFTESEAEKFFDSLNAEAVLDNVNKMLSCSVSPQKELRDIKGKKEVIMANRTITLDAATRLFINKDTYEDLTRVTSTDHVSYAKLSQDKQLFKARTTNVYLKNNHDDYFYFTLVETPDSTFFLKREQTRNT